VTRRRFLERSVGALAGAAVSSSIGGCSTQASRIDLAPRLTPAAGSRRAQPPLLGSGATFLNHINRGAGSGVNLGGVDYAPLPGETEVEVCPVAAGVVINSIERSFSGGTFVTVAHGLGWKTEYYHLERRLAGYRDRVARRDVVALMGSSGWGAARGAMGVVVHTHLTLWGPAYTPLFGGVLAQDWPQGSRGYQHPLDPEQFSVGGRHSALLYSRAEDAALDERFLAAHLEAVVLADGVLDRIGDAEAIKSKERTRAEREVGFDFHLDQRLWSIWQRLANGQHPFTPSETESYRARLATVMSTVPRLTAPIVEPGRRAEYRRPPGGH